MIQAPLSCKQCNKTYYVNRTRLISRSKYCSAPCRVAYLKINYPGYWLGKTRSTETIEKVRLAKLGKPSWNKGLRWPKEVREKVSFNRKGKCIGEENPRWVYDRTMLKVYGNDNKDRRSPRYGDWRKQVYKRDNFKCKMQNADCNGRIIAHHILGYKSYPELRYEINNGITLCQAHHPLKRAEEKRLAGKFTELVSVSKV